MENKKIKNATPTKWNGLTFRSALEAKVAKCLIENGISFEYEATRFDLLPKFEYNNIKYRAVHYTPDFICGNYIIEVKGFPNDVWPLKKKLILLTLINLDSEYKFREVKNLKQLKEVIKEIKNEVN